MIRMFAPLRYPILDDTPRDAPSLFSVSFDLLLNQHLMHSVYLAHIFIPFYHFRDTAKMVA